MFNLIAKRWKIFLVAVVILFLLVIGIFPISGYLLLILTAAGINALLALGTNLFFGGTGQVNFAIAGFYAIGAYTSALLQTKAGWSFLPAALAALIVTALIAWIISKPLLRLRELSIALASLTFGLAIFLFIDTQINLTGGGDGLSIPRLTFFSYTPGDVFFYFTNWILVAVVFYICYVLNTSGRVARALKALKEDEIAASCMGVNINKYMTLTFVLGSVFMGLAGVLLVQESGWIASGYFVSWRAFLVLIMVLLGGVGSNFGVVIGAIVITFLPEVLRPIQAYGSLIYGLILFLLLRFLPKGVGGSLRWR
jgi:branched-chain amino acid transport system permease protein